MALHLDILLHICDILAQENVKESLKSWALVCSALSKTCQGHLFACVTLLVKDHSRRMYRLWKVLRANPKLGAYIKELHISFSRPSKSAYANPEIPSILPYCTNVTIFKVRTPINQGFSGMWYSLPKATLVALESILYSPALTGLEIGGFGLPPLSSFFSPCSSTLTQIQLLVGTVEERHEPLNVRGVKGEPIFLREITLEPGTGLSSFLEAEREDGGRVFEFSRLQNLSAFCSGERDVQSINTLLFRRAAPLRTLKIQHIRKSLFFVPSTAVCNVTNVGILKGFLGHPRDGYWTTSSIGIGSTNHQ